MPRFKNSRALCSSSVPRLIRILWGRHLRLKGLELPDLARRDLICRLTEQATDEIMGIEDGQLCETPGTAAAAIDGNR